MGNYLSTSQPTSDEAAVSSKEELKHLAKVKRAEDARKEAIAANVHDNNKENQQLLKKLFKRLDPSVSEVKTDIQGEIQISLKYDFENSKLLVNVIKCRDLAVNSIAGKTAEPFVSLFLFPDPEDIGTKSTSMSANSQHPAFNEKFSFTLEEVSLADSRLVLKVMDHDEVNDDMEFLGEVIISMTDVNFMETPVHTAWYTLRPETDITISGELEISLNYTLPQTLSITVHQASRLKLTRERKPPSALVKVGIPGIEQSEATQVVPNEINPHWDETFTFDISKEELAIRYVVFTVLDQSTETGSLLGHVVIDLDNLDTEHGYHGPFSLSDMSSSDRLRSKWFETTQVQEFREALWAHSYFQYPSFLFQQHTGKKVIRLSCPAGGAKAKLRMNNGIPV
ncbi:synaptotagmin-1-like [Watersipora subatra]|uniref:synaptotagmin-1-like n=1 Tax=Watersipora subatra TaxID=2589382 RepID=UPI00355B2A58